MKEEKNTYFKSKDTSIFSIKQMINFQNRYFHIIECELDYNELIKKLLCEEYFKFMYPNKNFDEFLDICKFLLTLGNRINQNLYEYYNGNINKKNIYAHIGEILSLFCLNNVTYNGHNIEHAQLCYGFFERQRYLIESHQGADYIGVANDKYIFLDVKTIYSNDSSFTKNKMHNLKNYYSEIKNFNLEDVIIAKINDKEQILDIRRDNTILGFFVFQKNEFSINNASDILTKLCFCKSYTEHEVSNLCTEFKEGVLFHFKINSFKEIVDGFEKFFLGDINEKR